MPLQNLQFDALHILNNLPGGFFLYEAGGNEKMLYANSETLNIFGCSSLDDFLDYIGHSFRKLVHPDDLDRVESEITQQVQNSPRGLDTVEYRIIRKDGQVRWVDDFGHFIHDDKLGDIYYVFISDITEKKQLELSSAELARKNALEIDALTGLYTKDYFYKIAATYITQNPLETYSILTSDIENFRYINETYGVEFGDRILRATASISHLRGFVLGGRIDGDRFVYLFERNLLTKSALQDHVVSTCREFRVPTLPVKYGLYNIDENISVQAMCTRALLALDSIKGEYGTQFSTYRNTLRIDWMRKQQITASAESSLRDRQFLVYYQPKYDLAANCAGGAEALVRWLHPDYGFMNPGLFIPLFEKNGFITKLDLYIVEEVCNALKCMKQENKPVVPISINLSRRDLDKPGLSEKLIQIVDSYELPHSLIHFEITESCISENPEQTSACIQELHESGFAIELDDFGSGYSSLTALNRLPIDILKIDISIIQNDVPNSERNILEFTMQLARMMKMKTVQEGVETREQMLRVKELGCDYVQGFYFSKPLPKDEFAAYLANM